MTSFRHKLRKNKYNAKPTYVDNIRFDSAKEARCYSSLSVLKKNGDIIMFLRQTPFHLEAGVVYRLDFLVFWANGEVEFIDVKGRDTPMSKLKRKQVEALYHIKIKLV